MSSGSKSQRGEKSKLAESYFELGWTDAQVANKLWVSYSTAKIWRLRYLAIKNRPEVLISQNKSLKEEVVKLKARLMRYEDVD